MAAFEVVKTVIISLERPTNALNIIEKVLGYYLYKCTTDIIILIMRESIAIQNLEIRTVCYTKTT